MDSIKVWEWGGGFKWMKSVSGDHLDMMSQWHGYTGGWGWRFYCGFRRVLGANEGYKGCRVLLFGTIVRTLAAVELFEGSALVPLVWALSSPTCQLPLNLSLCSSPKLQVKALEYWSRDHGCFPDKFSVLLSTLDLYLRACYGSGDWLCEAVEWERQPALLSLVVLFFLFFLGLVW